MFHTAWGRLYKAEFLKKNNITFIEKNVICEDEGFFIKTLSHYPSISYIQDVGVMYRIRKGSIISKSLENKNAAKEKIKHVKLVLNDAFEHIAKTNSKKLSKKLIKKVKQSQTYGRYFDINFINIIKIILRENDKAIRLFNLSLYKEKIKDEQTKVYKVLGIEIKKEKINKAK